MGPTARANAPSDLKIPITVPFWSCDPSFETKVVIHGTTIAVAVTKQITSEQNIMTHIFMQKKKLLKIIQYNTKSTKMDIQATNK